MKRPFFICSIIALAGLTGFGAPKKKTVKDASEIYAEVQEAIRNYNPEKATELLDEYEASLRKSKKPAPAEVEILASRLVTMNNMLDRVQKIAVVDTFTVDSTAFIDCFRLSASAGKPGIDATGIMSFIPESAREVFTERKNKDGWFRLVSGGILDDGTREVLDEISFADAGEDDADDAEFNMRYPVLADDGETLYFAADSENSIGGLDIFMSRRTENGTFTRPQNMGMPFNSPYNDFLYVEDHESGLGWWVTDRNQDAGKVTVYLFKLPQGRVNVEIDDSDLRARAKLNPVSVSLAPDRADLARSLDSLAVDEERSTGECILIIPGGKMVFSGADLNNPQARQALAELQQLNKELADAEARLQQLRSRFGNGDTSVKGDILNLERRQQKAYESRQAAVNKVIKLEK